MRAARRSSRTFDGKESDNTGRSERVDIHGLKVWAKANLPEKSHLCGLLLLEEDLLTVDEFMAKMDLWLKIIELEKQLHI